MKAQTWKVVLIVGAIACGVYLLLPNVTSHDIAYSAMGLASVACIVWGVRWHRPADPLGWYLIAAAGLLFTLGDDVSSVYDFVHTAMPFPSWADALYLAGYPFLFAGVLRLARRSSWAIWREDSADAAIITIGVLAMSWQFLMDPYVHDQGMSTFGMAVNVAYPMMDVALIFIVLRAVVFRGMREPYFRIIAASMLVMFTGDFAYDVMTLHGLYSTGNLVDLLFLFQYALIGAAALHPSVGETRVVAPEPDLRVEAPRPTRHGRLPTVLVAGFVAPGILVIASAMREHVNVVALGVLCLVAFGIIGLRLNWLVSRMERQSRQLEENLMELTVAHLRRDQLEASLRHQTLHDPLTGLANRMLFEDRLARARERVARQSGINAVLMFDLDDFKQVNDAYGHFIGDQLLVDVARRLEAITRSSDTLCRFGGDEFLYLAEGLADAGEAEMICQRIIEALAEPFHFGDIHFEQHASIGLVICDYQDAVDAEYVRDADAAMYEAKRFHKGRYVVFEPSMHNEALSVFSLTQELRSAFQQGQLTMHFQPVVDLHTLRSVGFEALMRWPSAHRGWVPPDVFIPLAEESELIFDIGAFALREAVSVAATWAARGLGEAPFVTVNLSPRQLHDANVIAQVQSTLAHYQLSPEKLILEITERTALVNIDDTIAIVEKLNKLGVGMALDDFGTGHSSLSYIALLQPKIIKIDKSFVAPVHSGRESETLLETIVSLGRRLGITMLAEGIETTAQLERLRQLGCELGQGFLFSEAIPADKVSSRLNFDAATASEPRVN